MSLDALLGQDTARDTLRRALESGRLHHAYRFEGPAGVGKAYGARLFAQALLCPNRRGAEACGVCSSCERALAISHDGAQVSKHPDFIWVGRGIYPQSVIGASETAAISVEQIRRVILPRMGFPPNEGVALVILILDADELGIPAANALLKTLEEPPARTHFILTTERPRRLLDTIRSRTLPLRFGRLPDPILGRLLEAEGLPSDELALADGSLQQARELLSPEQTERRKAYLAAAEAAMNAPHPAAALRFAEERAEGRGEMLEQLAYLAREFARRAKQEPPGLLWAKRYSEVKRAMSEAERNGSPALVLETLMLRLRQG